MTTWASSATRAPAPGPGRRRRATRWESSNAASSRSRLWEPLSRPFSGRSHGPGLPASAHALPPPAAGVGLQLQHHDPGAGVVLPGRRAARVRRPGRLRQEHAVGEGPGGFERPSADGNRRRPLSFLVSRQQRDRLLRGRPAQENPRERRHRRDSLRGAGRSRRNMGPRRPHPHRAGQHRTDRGTVGEGWRAARRDAGGHSPGDYSHRWPSSFPIRSTFSFCGTIPRAARTGSTWPPWTARSRGESSPTAPTRSIRLLGTSSSRAAARSSLRVSTLGRSPWPASPSS